MAGAEHALTDPGCSIDSPRPMPSHDDCPCFSGLKYKVCCAPFHRGEREAPDAVRLMRSRYSAFAKKDGAYLWKTLHESHPSKVGDPFAEQRAIVASAGEHKYTGLTILDSSPPDEEGVSRVLFLARVFQRGKDLSFVELSEFLHDGDGFRYKTGDLVPLRALQGDVSQLRIQEMLSRARSGEGGLFR